MKKTILSKASSWLFALVIIVAMLPVTNLIAATNVYGNNYQFLTPISAPDLDVIPISSAVELNNARNNLDKSYVLMNDIDLSTWGEWEPIGDWSNPFTGDFDGQGHVIKDLTINDGTYQCIGLFGRANGATIKNVGLEGSSISISDSSSSFISLGGICGYSNGDISNCYNTGDITLTFSYFNNIDSFTGGICGSISSGTISNCHNTGVVSSTVYNSDAGGICGNSSGLIKNCYNTGSISSYAYLVSGAGGICGSSTGSIDKCYSTGDIFSSSSPSVSVSVYLSYSYAGGICAYSSGIASGSISNCAVFSDRINAENTGDPDSISSYIIGNCTTKSNNRAFFGISGNPSYDVDYSIGIEDAKNSAMYEKELNWDFADIWEMVEGCDYPQLRFYSPEIADRYTVSFKAGEHGTITPASASEKVAEGKTVTTVPGKEVADGYIFIGWKSTFGGIYDDEAVLLYPITRDITFTAVYADSANATVIFDYNGGRAKEMEYGKESYPDKDIDPGREVDSDYVSGRPGTVYMSPEPVKSGYVHSGWLRAAPLGWFLERPSGIYGPEKTVIKYIAQWAANINTVTFSAGANGTMRPGEHSEIVYYGESVKIVPEIEAKSGYVFIGWESNMGGVCDSEMVESYPVTGDITFTAQYMPAAKATVIFDYDGGTVEEDLPNYFSGEPGAPYTVLEPGKTGHTFAGWLPSEPSRILGEAGSTVVYIAQWQQNKYTVTFMNGENGTMTTIGGEAPLATYSEEVLWGESVSIVPFIEAASGYTFQQEWIKNGGSTYYSGEDILKTPITEDITFVAQYRKIIPAGTGGGGERPASATLTVKGIDKASDAIIYNQSVTAFVGDGETVSAPIIKGYVLDKDSPTSQTVTIKTGSNTVNFYYNYLGEEASPLDRSEQQRKFIISDKIMSALETDYHLKYIGGYPDGSVRPDGKITRAEVAIIFWRLLKNPAKNDPVDNGFTDLKGDEEHAQAVNYLAQLGIIQGYEDGSFRPFAAISRVEFAAIASRFDDLSSSTANPFTDVPEDYWAYGYIVSAYQKGWINGYPGGEFRPQSSISRAEAIKIVNCMLGRGIQLADLPEDLPSYPDLTRSHWAYCEIMEASVSHQCERKADGWEIWQERE